MTVFVSRLSILKAINYRLEDLKSGQTLTIGIGKLDNPVIYSLTVLKVPRGNYVWVRSGHSGIMDLPYMDFSGISSDVEDSLEAIVNLIAHENPLEEYIIDIESFAAIKESNSANKSSYIVDVIRKCMPNNVNILDFEFRITPSFFSGQNSTQWYRTVPKVAIALAILRGDVNYQVPYPDYLQKQGSEYTSRYFNRLRSSLVDLIRYE